MVSPNHSLPSHPLVARIYARVAPFDLPAYPDVQTAIRSAHLYAQLADQADPVVCAALLLSRQTLAHADDLDWSVLMLAQVAVAVDNFSRIDAIGDARVADVVHARVADIVLARCAAHVQKLGEMIESGQDYDYLEVRRMFSYCRSAADAVPAAVCRTPWTRMMLNFELTRAEMAEQLRIIQVKASVAMGLMGVMRTPLIEQVYADLSADKLARAPHRLCLQEERAIALALSAGGQGVEPEHIAAAILHGTSCDVELLADRYGARVAELYAATSPLCPPDQRREGVQGADVLHAAINRVKAGARATPSPLPWRVSGLRF